MAPDATAWYAVILLAVGAVFWVWRSGTRQIEAWRDVAGKLERLGARVLAAASRREVGEVLEQDLPAALGPVALRLYLYERGRRTLEAGVHVIPVHAPAEGEPAAIALAFRHRVSSRLREPGSAEITHYLPCELGDEAHGVLVLRGEGLAEADSTSLNYLARQIGATLARLNDAETREHEARAEKRQAVSEVLQRVIAELEHDRGHPAIVERLRALMREEDRQFAQESMPQGGTLVRTTLLLEPDAARRRAYLSALSERGIRALPVQTVDEAVDRLERLAFDVVFCSAKLAETGWPEVAHRLGRRTRLVWLADVPSLRWVEGSGLAVLQGAEELDAVIG
ncbi:MAG: hypothetical protein K2X03_14860 [Bryobacteraceae bacterium]|nr:hypothetical protein [Bryobacteraceae bacterium]